MYAIRTGLRPVGVATLLVTLSWVAPPTVVVAADDAARDEAVTGAVERALKFLAATQQTDGSWLSSGRYQRNTAIASLAVMAFLAGGHTPLDGPYQQHIRKGVAFVMSRAQPNGFLSDGAGRMYGHGTSTLMLAEVVGMAPESMETEVREKLKKGVRLILEAQNVPKGPNDAGGWRYQPTSRDSDISCSGWQLMALRAARNAGCDVPSSNIDKAVAYLKQCAHRAGGFGYKPGGGPNRARTGTGILGLEICGRHHTPEARAGAEYLMRNPPVYSGGFLFYGIYYCAQGMFQMGGRYWESFKPQLEKMLVDHQATDGSWLSPGGHERQAGKAYCTAMAVLALSVPYHYLPIYQR